MEVKSSGHNSYPIDVRILDNHNFITLEEFDTLLRKMVEFRVTYDECRNITEEVKEEGRWDRIEREEAGNFDEYEEQAYEAERIARDLEFQREEQREWEERTRNEHV